MNNQVVSQELSMLLLSKTHLNFLNVFIIINKRQIYANDYEASLRNIQIKVKIWFIFRIFNKNGFGLFMAQYACKRYFN